MKRKPLLATVAAGAGCLAVLIAAVVHRDGIRALISKDFAARLDVIRLIEERRTPEHRMWYQVTVPETMVPIPAKLELYLEGRFLATQLLGIRIRDGEDAVRGWMASRNGLFEGEIPRWELERFFRRLRYLQVAKLEAYSTSGEMVEKFRRLFVTSSPYYSLEVSASEPEFSMAHQSSGQAVIQTIQPEYSLKDFIHTWACEEVLRLARAYLPAIDPALREKRILEGLQSVHRSHENTIHALVYAHLAVEWRVAAAKPELERLGYAIERAQLGIATSTDPRKRLVDAIRGVSSELATWALDFLAESVRPEWRKDVLIAALEGEEGAREVKRFILEDLAGFPGDSAVEEALRRAFRSSLEGSEFRICAAGAFLRVSGDEEAFSALIAAALEPGNEALAPSGLQELAVRELIASLETGPSRRGRIAEALRALLARIPPGENALRSGLLFLVEGLGRSGTPEDESLLAEYLAHEEDGFVATVIEALARLRPERAIEEARRRIQLYCQSRGAEHSFRWSVQEPIWLLCVLNSPAAIPDIEAAREVLLAVEPAWTIDDEPLLIDASVKLLRARDPKEAARAAVDLVKRCDPPRDDLFLRLVARLREAGATPEQLAPLLVEPPRRKRYAP